MASSLMSQDSAHKRILLNEYSSEENVAHSITLSINGKLSILVVVESLLGFDIMFENLKNTQYFDADSETEKWYSAFSEHLLV